MIEDVADEHLLLMARVSFAARGRFDGRNSHSLTDVPARLVAVMRSLLLRQTVRLHKNPATGHS